LAAAPNLMARALQALARREHSRQELQDKLQRFEENPGELSAVLDQLEKHGWLSEQRYVEQLTGVRRRKFGAARIVSELRGKGVSEEALEKAQVELGAGEIEAARAVWKKKFGVLPEGLKEKARQARFLAGRGFSAEVVHAVLKLARDD
jgi:regulatory protein